MEFLTKAVDIVEEGLIHARNSAIGTRAFRVHHDSFSDRHFPSTCTDCTSPYCCTGVLNPNRRHDDPDEQRDDEIRAAICASHRFNSFAAERTQNFVKWYMTRLYGGDSNAEVFRSGT